MVFCSWLLSVFKIHPYFIMKQYFIPFNAKWCSVVWLYHILLPIYQLMEICVVSTFWSVMNNVAVDIHVQVFVCMYVVISLGYIL